MKVLLTGASGFLGWHTRVRAHARSEHQLTAIDRTGWRELARHAQDADAIIHVAGVNRGTETDVEGGNLALAYDVADAARCSGSVTRIVFANSIQSGNATPYGRGKAAASALLARACAEIGATYVDVRLPNLFGEHGRPRYNSFVATFAAAVVADTTPQVADRPVDLLHAQRAAQVLLDALEKAEDVLEPAGSSTTVLTVLETLGRLHTLYAGGDIPPLTSDLELDLFNTLRATRFPSGSPIPLAPRSDHRGRLVEVVRSHGGRGQTFVSTTEPGATRGQHFHLRKMERFVVVDGSARIRLRRLFSDEVVSFDVTGSEPVAVDMPTLWAHAITNTGRGPLTTLFWTNELFDPSAPDTYAEDVTAVEHGHPAPLVGIS